ncbi:MerR family transcriptional regulator [Aneurinibacillus migulanus]|nr:helix-turn-helix domain-containing protein [Aneurinibacillus migulanus]KIV56229.1 transcriptional regulator [Aneurinibacillus migulanus]KON84297.1 transcriptional regulator [Aneurinibacillus migulanus]MED0893852.1 DNA-binding protein [Aneurinibacillus migulanus]MED1614531.1 DNA-binding protein [Aneurinibacillus migulanus]GED15025.1 transcriptional regulator [Aneurinibacillus migulanus]
MASEITFKSKDELTAFIVNEVINTTEALEILGCSRQNLNDLIKRKVITPIKELPRDRLFYKSDILKRKEQVEKRKR